MSRTPLELLTDLADTARKIGDQSTTLASLSDRLGDHDTTASHLLDAATAYKVEYEYRAAVDAIRDAEATITELRAERGSTIHHPDYVPDYTPEGK